MAAKVGRDAMRMGALSLAICLGLVLQVWAGQGMPDPAHEGARAGSWHSLWTGTGCDQVKA